MEPHINYQKTGLSGEAFAQKMLLISFFAAVFMVFLTPISDPDFPFHLKTGEYIVQHGAIPKDDPFSFYGEGVVTDRERFTLSQYWITQILFYWIYAAAGPAGIVLFRAFTFTLIIYLLWVSLRKRGWFSSLTISALIAFMFMAYSLDRPQNISFLFIVITVTLIERYRVNPGSPIPLFFLPGIMLLWANMHAGFVFGIMVLCIYSVAGSLSFFLKSKYMPEANLDRKQMMLFTSALFLSVLVSYINPVMSQQLVATLSSHSEARWLYKTVKEYMTPVAAMSVNYGLRPSVISFFILFVVVASGSLFHIRRTGKVDPVNLILIIFGFVAAFSAVRYIPLCVGLTVPLSRNYSFFEKITWNSKIRAATYSAFFFFILFVIVTGVRHLPQVFRWNVNAYPERAANFLLENRINARMFNLPNKGSYLIWKLYPHYRVFNDTRFISLEAVQESEAISSALDYYEQPYNLALGKALGEFVPENLGRIDFSSDVHPGRFLSRPLWKKLLDEHKIDLIVHEACYEYTKQIYPLTLQLLRDDEWVLIFLDGELQIFLRDKPEYSEFVRKFRLPKKMVYDEIKLETIFDVSSKVPDAPPYSSLGFALLMKGNGPEARNLAEAALSIDKADITANFIMAYLALMEKAEQK